MCRKMVIANPSPPGHPDTPTRNQISYQRACFSRAIYSPLEDVGVAVFADGGSAAVKSLDLWTMKPIW